MMRLQLDFDISVVIEVLLLLKEAVLPVIRRIHPADSIEKHFGSGRSQRMPTRLAAYWMWTMNQAVDIVYARKDTC